MFAIAKVLDVVPSRTKYGERPSEDRRVIIRRCCGRYDMRMPNRMKTESEKFGIFGSARAAQCEGFISDIVLLERYVLGVRHAVELLLLLCFDDADEMQVTARGGWWTCRAESESEF
jgi:hypothetical protein